jgi:hypothetical protein
MYRAGDDIMIRDQVAAGTFEISEHALKQMNARQVTREDLIEIARTCNASRWQTKHQTWLFIGTDTAGEKGRFSAVLKEGAVVVTVMPRRKGR